MELLENGLEHWKAKFIDGLPLLFVERFKKTLRNSQGAIPYGAYTYGKLIGACTQEGSETDKLETYGNTQSATIDAWLLKEVNDNTLRENIIQHAANIKASSSNVVEKSKNEFEYSDPYTLSEVNNRLSKQHVVIRDTSFDDLKGEIEQLKQEIKSLKQNQIIYDHHLSQIESANNKGKNIVEENTLAKSINIDPKQNMFLRMM
ncbi:uncharacterized protein LOC125856724 [Solanum stenotomum]|uniref:uncharacterized protein LOC125856724 n=1 Tax=Solanum stenotomum TaxID=172797 RepID=UPI0020D0C543|nr:uncharacterized protein LOC125856724 [Solanum stenotomum]